MTKKSGRSAENDPGLSALLNSETSAICLVGKSCDFHVDVALGISKEENIENIKESTKLLSNVEKTSLSIQSKKLLTNSVNLLSETLLENQKQNIQAYVSDKPKQFQKNSAKFLGNQILDVQKVDI